MAESVLERALYSHFKSTEAEPKRYITIYKEQDADGYTYIHYVSYDDWDTIHIREETEFLEMVEHNGISMGRFMLVQLDIITLEEADTIKQNNAENN